MENGWKWLTDSIPEGQENAISARELRRIVGKEARNLRREIEKARKSGILICSSERGYYFPSGEYELREYIRTANNRIITSAECLAPFLDAMSGREGSGK